MSDLDRLRKAPRPAPTHEQLAHVLQQGKRRQGRLMLVGATGGGAAIAALVGVLVLGNSVATNTLRIDTPATSPTPAHQVLVQATPRPNSGSGSVRGAVPAASPSAQNIQRPASAAPTVQASEDRARQQPAGQERVSQRSEPMHRAYSGDSAATVCGGKVEPAPPTHASYCGSLSANVTDGVVNFDLSATLDAVTPMASQLTFGTAQEVDIVVRRNGRTVFKWSQGRSFAHTAHSLRIDPGASYDWTTAWTVRGLGTQVPHGIYEVVGTVLARELGASNTWTASIDL